MCWVSEGSGFDRGLEDIEVREIKEDVEVGMNIEGILRVRTAVGGINDIKACEEGMEELLGSTDMLETTGYSVIDSVAVTVATKVSSRDSLTTSEAVKVILLTRTVLE